MRRIGQAKPVTITLALLLMFGSSGLLAQHDGGGSYHPIEHAEFEEVWARTDLPVLQGEVARTWIWGPGAFSETVLESYIEGDGGERLVQYFDKSRMELPALSTSDPGDSDPTWFITQGLLARELMTGELQLGDEVHEQHHPSSRSAAGDPGDQMAPTYRVLGEKMGREPRVGDSVIIERLDREGAITEDAARYTGYGITDVSDAFTSVDGVDKNIASIFWEFMTSRGLVYEDGAHIDGRSLFENPFYAVGYPLTDAFWADVTVAGNLENVLIQCFERRCLTYTPGNPEGWKVESGNIGQHYYKWRYGEIPMVAEFSATASFNGSSDVTIEVGESVMMTVHIRRNGLDFHGARVEFEAADLVEAIIAVDPLQAETGPDGKAHFVITGIRSSDDSSPEPSTAKAKFTIDRSPPEIPVDIIVDLAPLRVTVYEPVIQP